MVKCVTCCCLFFFHFISFCIGKKRENQTRMCMVHAVYLLNIQPATNRTAPVCDCTYLFYYFSLGVFFTRLHFLFSIRLMWSCVFDGISIFSNDAYKWNDPADRKREKKWHLFCMWIWFVHLISIQVECLCAHIHKSVFLCCGFFVCLIFYLELFENKHL